MAVEEQENISVIGGNGRRRGGIALGGSGLTDARRRGYGLGLLKGLLVTLKHLFKHNTVIEYPDEKQDLPSRTRGVIALKEENCTVCMLCARECPDWCIYIDSHKETLPAKREGGRQRKRNVLDRFAIDYALCMYCGICVEVCPYDALFWSREFEYAEYDIRQMTHEKEKLSDWMETVLPPPPLEAGAQVAGGPPSASARSTAAAPAAPATAPPQESTPVTEQRPADPSARVQAPAPEKTAPEGEKPAPAPEQPAPEGEKPAPAPEEPAPQAEAGPSAPPEPAAPEASSDVEVPQVEVPHEEPRPVALEPVEDPEGVYQQVLEEQLDKGSSPQVAEARAKVARVKAERGIPRTPTPVAVDKPVPSAPTKAEAGRESQRPGEGETPAEDSKGKDA